MKCKYNILLLCLFLTYVYNFCRKTEPVEEKLYNFCRYTELVEEKLTESSDNTTAESEDELFTEVHCNCKSNVALKSRKR